MIVYCCAVCDAVSSVWTHAFAAYTLYTMPYSSIHVYSSHECYMYRCTLLSTSTILDPHLGFLRVLWLDFERYIKTRGKGPTVSAYFSPPGPSRSLSAVNKMAK